uniref:Uncharacterized protein n=1 Tax=Micrurus corallinus TaxID=54390 RepID=A0A2D4EVK3_MICCO
MPETKSRKFPFTVKEAFAKNPPTLQKSSLSFFQSTRGLKNAGQPQEKAIMCLFTLARVITSRVLRDFNHCNGIQNTLHCPFLARITSQNSPNYLPHPSKMSISRNKYPFKVY